ncbi:hypothetical protein BGP_1669 [Beggiatoa sp. PS]|nr:hypothetical protein BGP_1669 [Beggiatoa sp. PS]
MNVGLNRIYFNKNDTISHQLQPFPLKILIERKECKVKATCSQECLERSPFSVEYIRLQSKGDKTTLDNLALIRQDCNNHKYTKAEYTINL